MLEVTDLHVSYGAISRAGRGHVHRGSQGAIVTLIGGNGAGKTTALRTLSGLLKPKAARSVFRGEEIGGRAAHQIVALGLGQVPEGRMVFANLTVAENLAMGAYLLRDAAAVARHRENVFSPFSRALQGAAARQPAGTLSGGEQQMLRSAAPSWADRNC